ncbi:MAG: hypothetical protein LBS56_01885 [Propionibacteriaceae bacterium]|jgi:hypothetical protein|nr:hypothetical protein [Propionibacteriaceae bacterium]
MGHVNASALLRRHTPQLSGLDPSAPLQLGNGQFALAIDPTGLQTFPQAYPVAGSGTLLGTYAGWGWHQTPGGMAHKSKELYRGVATPRGSRPYLDATEEGTGGPAQEFFRANPHRVHLGRLGLDIPSGMGPGQLGAVDQELDLGLGLAVSRYTLGGVKFAVHTAVDTRADRLVVRLARLGGQRVGVTFDFPMASELAGDGQDWGRPDAHTTAVRGREELAPGVPSWLVERRLDRTVYWLRVTAPGAQLAQAGSHSLVVARTARGDRPGWVDGVLPRATGWLELVVEFAPTPPGAPPNVDTCLVEAAVDWKDYWNRGGALDLSRSDDPWANEIERRVVLSHYLLRVNSIGLQPRCETGLLVNSDRGKAHLAAQVWHVAALAQWGHADLLTRPLTWYGERLTMARTNAQRLRLPGVAWPAVCGPDGRETPNPKGGFPIWQQPQPIYLAELVYRAQPTTQLLNSLADTVMATAEFMAAYPAAIEEDGPWGLGPPLVPAQGVGVERAEALANPTFELTWWWWGLETAATWCERLGRWEDAAEFHRAAGRLARPRARLGRYPVLLGDPWPPLASGHPMHVAALGLVPRTGLIDDKTMEATLEDVLENWDFTGASGCDYPMMALTAARLHRPDLAVRALTFDRPENTYLVNGHNWQSDAAPAHLAGNGALLLAAGAMAAGWDGSEDSPGFARSWAADHGRIARLP